MDAEPRGAATAEEVRLSAAEVARALSTRAALFERLAGAAPEAVVRLARRYAATLERGGTLFFAGNGGSAADAQHLATEYVVRFRATRRAFRAIALTTDSSLLTACGNDLGFAEVFARQIEALAGPDDLVILHSTSGDSPNVVRAAETARARGVSVVGFLGRGGGAVRTLLDDAILVPSDDAAAVQEAHLALEHLIVGLVEELLAA